MKNTLLSLALAAMLAAPAFADAEVESIVIHKAADAPAAVNVRVNVHNPDDAPEFGPMMVSLFVRDNAADEWTLVKRWHHHDKIAPGYRVTHDYFPGAYGVMNPDFYDDYFQVMAVVADGEREYNTKVASYNEALD